MTKTLDAYTAKPASKDTAVESLLADTATSHRMVVERAKRLEQEALAETGNVLGDTEQPATRILLQREDEIFTLDLHFAAF